MKVGRHAESMVLESLAEIFEYHSLNVRSGSSRVIEIKLDRVQTKASAEKGHQSHATSIQFWRIEC